MLGLYPVADVRAAEEEAMARGPAGSLMARAAFGLAVECARLLRAVSGGVAGRRVVILVGSGNNGGDALFAGAELQRRGAQVIACTLGQRWHDAGARALLAAGGRLTPPTPREAPEAPEAPEALGGGTFEEADLIIDGVVGIGASGPLRPDLASVISAANRADALRVAVDIPSGVDPDTGDVPGDTAFDADLTVTFGVAKRGLFARPGSAYAGAVRVVDIGLDEHIGEATWNVLGVDDILEVLPEPRDTDHKYLRGVVGLGVGSHRYPGAALLTAGGARYSGTGMTMLVDRGDGVAGEVIGAYPEVVATNADPRSLTRVRAWVCGPGFTGDRADAEFIRVLTECEAPLVLDAGALTAVADDEDLRHRIRARFEAGLVTVLTPHAGEYSRLFGDGEAAAPEIGAIVVRKGPATVIEGPFGAGFIDTAGTSVLATAGSGDVLAGLIGGLLAHNPSKPAIRVVAAAVWLHGMSGRCAAAADRPIVAGDLVRVLPDVVSGVRRGRLPC